MTPLTTELLIDASDFDYRARTDRDVLDLSYWSVAGEDYPSEPLEWADIVQLYPSLRYRLHSVPARAVH